MIVPGAFTIPCGTVGAHELENLNACVTGCPLSITSHLFPARPALMSRLNPPPFSRRPLRPGLLKRAVLEIAALETGRPSVPRQQFGMPVDNGCGAIVITDPSSPDPPAYATGNGAQSESELRQLV